MKEVDKILCCPFCGHVGDPVKENMRTFYPIVNGKTKERVERDYYLECDGCGLILGNDMHYDQWGDNICEYSTREEALKVWNTRHN